MRRVRDTARLKKTSIVLFSLIVASYVLYSTGTFVAAYRENKNAYIFPTAVSTMGWQNEAHALAQELPADAPFSSFNRSNAAFISLSKTDEPAAPAIEPIPAATSSPLEATSTLQASEPGPGPDSVPPAEAPSDHVQPGAEPSDPEPAAQPTVQPDVPSEAQPDTQAQPDEPEPQPSSGESDAPVSATRFNAHASIGAFMRSVFSSVPIAYATSSQDEMTGDAEDTATCTLQQKDCHTITLSGFDVGGTITDRNFKRALVNFSFAARVGESNLTDDKLEVRYFHNGTWREVGEIYLNKEFSNAANGGYFSAVLDDVASWEDIKDVRLVIEYDRNNNESAELYLDSAWINVEYNERALSVVRGDLEFEGVPENVTTVLDDESATAPSLELPGGAVVSFPYTDDLDDALMVRTDKDVYGRGGDEMYVSVTNVGAQTDSFRLFAAFPQEGGDVVTVEQLKRNVPKTRSTPVYNDVTYFCEGGWISELASSSAPGYRCEATGEVQQCSALNDDTTNCSVERVEVGTEQETVYVNEWVLLERGPVAGQALPMDAFPQGFFARASTYDTIEILPGQTVYLRLSLLSPGDGALSFALFAQGDAYRGDLVSSMLASESALRAEASADDIQLARKKGVSRMFGKADFDGDETPEFKFTFKSKRGPIARAWSALTGRGNHFEVASVRIVRDDGEQEDIPVTVEYGEDGEWSLKVTNRPRSFRPGKYHAEIVLKEGADIFSESVEFYWGVLALNIDKSSYVPGETINFSMAALDDRGDTICNADLGLSVSMPDGSLVPLEVKQSGLCEKNNVIDVADYTARMALSQEGTYGVTLTEYDDRGYVVHRVVDTFTVRQSSPFTIRRAGMTRIYPVAVYTMTLELTATQDFDGEFIESIPPDFQLVESGGAQERMFGNAKNLVWPVSIKAGETKRFTYMYDAPDISPYLYVLGPSELRGERGLPFSEDRQWKIASDATGNMLLYWDSTYIPSGWTCVSCLPADPFYQRFVMGSSTAGTNGGSATTAHTGTGTVNASVGSQTVGANNQATPVVAHTHTLTPTITATSTLPAYRNLAIIQYNSTGEPPSIPAGAIAMFDTTVPSGWTRYAAQDGRYIRGESTSTVGTTGGGSTHRHDVSGTTGAAATTVNAQNPGTAIAVAANLHTHTISTSTSMLNHEPPYMEVVLGKLTATSTPTNQMIAMWSGDPPTGWTTTSSSSEAMANKFGKASTTYGTTGGAFTHSHIDITGLTSSAPSATVNRNNVAGTTVASAAHTHSVSVTSISTDSHLPPYRTAVFAKRVGGAAPAGPTVHVLFNNEKTGTSTPHLEFTASDPDGSDTLVYQVQWDDDSDLNTSPIGDRTSDVETGCSPNCFENLVTGGDTSPFNEAERIRFTIQSPLVSGTTYYWRVRAKESGGGGAWGSWATTSSFTYVSGINPSQWFQTEDGQFDADTLSNVATYGAGSARLVLSPPTEALVAYGEGAVQTPRYRLWNGSSWGSELSAQNVGGTVQWIVTKAGPTRNEYILGTQDGVNDVNVQVYNGTSGTWGNLQEVTTSISNNARRGFDVAYEQQSGDALVVYCDGDADPSYYVWNGTSWTSGGTINLASANNCEWIKLASDPISDEIILVARDTGTQYEMQVWDGAAWGHSQTMGAMQDVAHEGIAVEYEESGNQAMVAVSNNTTAGFRWSTWDGSGWSVPANQTLGDDFEWGTLKADDGSDKLALCYIDQDADIGTLVWDGNAWATFSAAANEREITGNIFDGRAVDCQYETTTGRDGYLMLPYSDTTNGRYQYYNGSSWSAEASVGTVQDSWTVSSIRTGDGKILALFHDDVNARYDVSDWNGSSWSAQTSIETSPSVTVAPFLQPFDLVAQVYQSSSGTVTSPVIDFDDVSGRQQWGEVSFRTTEPSGTDVKVQVYYETGGACTTLVPNGTLPGNSTGFDATSSPINISGLSTSTYNRICLKATLTTTNTSQSSLDEWTVTWQRQPFYTQKHYRWYANAASSLTPSDPWPSGANDIPEDTAIPTAYSPSPGEVLRLRTSLLISNVALSASQQAFKLQYALGASCSASLTWQDVGATGSTTAKWRGYDNAALSDGATLVSNLIASATEKESYEEQNYSSSNPNSVAIGSEGEWDWVLQHNASSSESYCFRMVTDGGEVLNAYDAYPALVTNAKPDAPTLEAPFDNEALASTTPWFQFVSDEPENDDMTYQVQIDDDATFASPNIDRDSQNNFDDFTNIVTPADKDPFTASQSIRFIPTTALSNGTTYYWRVRAKDRNKSAEWSSWSTTQSFTVNTSITISTWMQTTNPQFTTDTNENTEATSTGEVRLQSGQLFGTTTSSMIDFDWKTAGNAWGSLSWNDDETTGDIKYHIEYYDGTSWEFIPDTDLAGNAAGFDTSPVSLLGIAPTTYNQIRIRADLIDASGSPRLNDWTLAWGYAVSQPVPTALFDNEKTATTTPTFAFSSTDPQGDDLVYEISISTTQDFSASTTRRSSLDAGFVNAASSTDTSPFIQNNSIRFTLQQADALTNGQTYWWRVRAIDPSGGNVWSVWSDLRSFTVDTSLIVSTWFQTTNEQWATDALSNVETNSGSARITTTIREAFTAYAEGTVQVPRFRIWNGTSWGTEQSGVSVGDTIRFVEAAAAPTRDEYMIATQGASGGINAQVVNGTTDTAGNKQTISAATDATQRGFDIAYETSSGDALMVACSGTEATYAVWNGSSWSATTTITLALSTNCEWVKLISDPTSDEIIAIFRDTTTGATDYEAQVWNGTSWGNAVNFGSQATVANEGIAAEYEESGGQAVIALSNGINNNFIWQSWNGSAWSGTATVAIGNDFEGGRIVRDLGSDNMALCYVDADSDIGYVRWNGSAWGAFSEFEVTGNSLNGRPVSCEFETTSGRDGYIMIPYSDTIQAEYVFWNGSVLSGAALLTTISDAAEIRTARTGDGLILALAYDDANTEYDFTYWNGTAWSAENVLETTSITTVAPPTIPLDIVARRYPAFTSGTVESTTINFSDGSGPRWGAISFSKTTPGSSSVALQVEYFTSTSSWALIPDSVLPGNSTGTTTSPVDLTNVNRTTYGTIRLIANLTCVSGQCPTLNDWTLSWAQGITVSGTAKQYDETSNVTSGTVRIAVNGVLQSGKTGTISGGAWSIANVTVFQDDIVTVFVDGANDANEAVAVTKYDGDGDITGVSLIERHLTIGSVDNPSVTNANIGQYDNSVSGDEDIFYDVDAGNDLAVCALASGCSDAELYILAGATFRPDSASSGNVSTFNLENNGSITADGNTFNIAGSWDNNATFTKNTSTVVFTATSSTQTVDSTGASVAAFNHVTFGQASGSATWNLASALDVDGTLTVNYGTLNQNGAKAINVAGNLTIGASGAFTKGTASTTFDGSGTSIWTDSTAAKQDLGIVVIDGTAKTILLGAAAKATDIVIGSDDTLSVDNNYALEVKGSWTNNNAFLAQSGTVTFSATSTGKTIIPGSSPFYNITFSGAGGNWAFSAAVTAGNNFTIATGTVTLPSSTTTITGSFDASGGTFMHNNGEIVFNASAASKTVHPGSSSFYDITFNGSGSWSFASPNATSSRHFTITQGAVTLPGGTLSVGGSFAKNGGSFSANNGTLKMTASSAQTIRLGGTDLSSLTFSGVGGTWSFVDTSATTTNSVRFEAGTSTLPSNVFAVGGSWTVVSGAFSAGGGTVRFNATSTGRTISPGNATFYNVLFDGGSGGWTLSSATSTNNFTLQNASSFTLSSGASLAIGGTFTNAVSNASTTFTNTKLTLYSGTSYAINTKTSGGDTYATLILASSTKASMWNSSVATTTTSSGSSLYSQDNGGVDGDLYIYGDYTRSAGNEYWSYATDFDGTALSGSSRQVNVRIASSSTLTFSGGTLHILGVAAASTSIAVQGSGGYAWSVTGGTLNARYYAVRNTDANGLNMSGTPTITSLDDGDFESSVQGGTLIKVASTVIDQNTTLQIQRTRFATSTGIASGFNVTETGTPGSYWWFRSHYGSLAGESFDSDPGGNPGYVRWDDSNLSITVSGRVYSDHGSTAIGNPPCDGSTPVVKIVVNGGATFSGACDAGSGAFSIPNVSFNGDAVLTAYLDTNGGKRAAVVTRTPTTDIGNFDLYENAVIVRHEDVSPITISHLALYDSTSDSDIPFTASTSSVPWTLTTRPDTELYVWQGKTFTPGGNVTLASGGSGNVRDGRLMLATSSAFIATGSESHAIGGGLSVASGSTFTPGSSTFTFTATTSGKSINSSVALTFNNLTFNGTGGAWSLDSSATTTVTGAFALSAGTLQGTGSLTVNGGATGNGTFAMTGGTVSSYGTGNFGSANPWTFYNLTFGTGSSGTSTKTGVGTTTVTGVLTVSSGYQLNASSSPWVLSGSGTPFVVGGTFMVQTAPFYFTGTGATTVADAAYADLHLTPAAAGTPTYTLRGGTLSAANVYVGGANPVTVDANANDPSMNIAGSVTIASGSTLIASNVGAFDVGGSWLNSGTFTHSNGSVRFNSTDTGETINPGSSSFYDLIINSASGGWTITQHATSSRNFTLTNAASFTLSPNKTLAVGGTFTNSVGGSATTWATSTLYLYSGTTFAANTKSNSGDSYGTIIVAANTDVSMWNSSAATTTVDSTGSLYSQDHAGLDGTLSIWGEYVRASGTEYWSYATDFDGTALGGSSRQVNVRIATSSTITLSGGTLEVLGAANATTTIANQGTGRYALSVSGGTLNAQYFQLRDTDANGLNISGSVSVTELSDGDFEVGVQGGSAITVAGTVIDANPLKIFLRDRFATSTGITSGFNVKATGSTASSWKFNLHYGAFGGEAYDSDPGGDPGYLRWDDSATAISISGNVYSDEGSTVSAVCNGATQVVRLKVQGAGTYTSSCNASTGAYSISPVNYNPGDTLTVYLDTNGGAKAANVSVDPVSTITTMHLYQNRVIVRHEDTTPITIANMALYDSDNDTDIPFNATDAASDTLVVIPNTKLIVWDGKTFAPGGNVTLQSGNTNAYDGTLELRTNAVFTASGAESHTLGGSFVVGSGATFTPASSTVTFTATTTGKTITPNASSFYNIVFNGSGGNWAFSGAATTQNDFTITSGTVTLPSATSTVGGSFQNTGGTFMHNNGALVLTATSSGKTVRANGSSFYQIQFNGSGGSWTMSDVNATSSSDFIITSGSVTLPSGTLSVGGSFTNAGSFTAGSTVKMTSNAAGKSITPGTSSFYNLTLDGLGGAWTFASNATSSGAFTILNGSTTLPSNVFAVGGSWSSTGGSFSSASGTVKFIATSTGRTITPGSSTFYNALFDSSSGGWTVSGNATSTNDFSITNASSFTVSPNVTLSVGGAFGNSVGGAATTWATSTLYLYSGTGYTINTKSAGKDVYGTVLIGANTDVRMWNSSAATTTVDSTGSLYSMDHAESDGSLYIWGEYVRASGSDYWDYATDFDGTALGGSPRQVNVRIASSSSVTLSGGTLEILGASAATTTIANQSAGRYAFAVSGGTLNAQYYQLRNMDANGLSFSGTPTVTSLNAGDLELDITGGSLMTIAGTVIDANASKTISGVRFATSTGVWSGSNVTRTGSPISAWTFSSHYGNRAGESYDSDGGDACGSIRWDDSSCLFVNQAHYRWRADDGGAGVPNSEWYNASWSRRKKIAITNPTGSTVTNQAVKIVVEYDSDMQSDFDDLRFTDSSGTTSIPYWIEKSTASASSTVWVKVPSIGAGASADVYLYYGNASVTTTGDGTQVFSFFDDFEDDNISEYSGNTSLFDTDTTYNHNYSYGLDAGANVDQKTTSGIYRTTSSYSARGMTLRFYQYVDAAAEDEPCTLFAVQGSGQNYAVCLDQYPSERVAIAKNVTSNDGSGTSIASTSVTYTTGWYEVVVDWLTNNSINVAVYDDTGSLFASVSGSDSSYASGGIGFSFWAQHGGWDFYSSRNYMSSAPTYIFGTEQISGGASYLAAEDAAVTGVQSGSNVRLRFSVQNSGAPISSQNFRLQYAAKGNALNCESVPYVNYADVPTTSGGCGGAPACMTTSSQFTNQASISSLLGYPGSMSFTNGQILEDPSNQTSAMTVGTNNATEIEYNFQFTGNATQNAYCFRTTNGGTSLDNYTHVAEAGLTFPPVISNFALNAGSDIALTEGATTTISATGTVTDLNGFADLSFATSTIYRSGVGASCSANANNCYQIGSGSCTFSNCSGTSCTVTCRADIEYIADPTDAGSAFSAQNWLAKIWVQDTTGYSDEDTALGVDVLTLYGLSVTPNINFGSLQPGDNTGAINATTTIRNTGNTNIDIQVAGTDLAGSLGSIGVGEEKFATSTFAYASCSVCQFLTGSAANVEVDLPKPTSTSTAVTDELFWGINVPIGTSAELHQGTNTFIATSD